MKKQQKPQAIVNRRASFDYFLEDEIVVGLVLTGAETKAARLGHVQLKGSYVTINGGELYLINASFSVKTGEKAGVKSVDSRSRKLLARRRQIDQLIENKKDGRTIVPLKLLTNGRFIKLVIAVGKGKKRYDKRQTIKKRDLEREIRNSGKI
jgi:SsrA-binding protein